MFLVPAVKDFRSELLAGAYNDGDLVGDKRAKLFYIVTLYLGFATSFNLRCIESSKLFSPYVSISADGGFPSPVPNLFGLSYPGAMLLSCSLSTYLFGLCQSLLRVGLRLVGDFSEPNLEVLLENAAADTYVGLV